MSGGVTGGGGGGGACPPRKPPPMSPPPLIPKTSPLLYRKYPSAGGGQVSGSGSIVAMGNSTSQHASSSASTTLQVPGVSNGAAVVGGLTPVDTSSSAGAVEDGGGSVTFMPPVFAKTATPPAMSHQLRRSVERMDEARDVSVSRQQQQAIATPAITINAPVDADTAGSSSGDHAEQMPPYAMRHAEPNNADISFTPNRRNSQPQPADDTEVRLSLQASLIQKLQSERAEWQRKIVEIEREKRMAIELASARPSAAAAAIDDVTAKGDGDAHKRHAPSQFMRSGSARKQHQPHVPCGACNKMQSSLTASEATVRTLTQSDRELRTTIDQLQSDLHAHRHKLDETVVEYDELKADFESEQQKLRSMISRLEAGVAHGKSTVAKRDAQLQDSAARVAALGERASHLESAVAEATAENDSLRAVVDAAERDRLAAEERIVELTDKIARLEAEKSTVAKQEQLRRSAATMKLESERKDLEDKLARSQTQFDKAAIESKKQIATLTTECASWRKLATDNEEAIAQHELDVKTAQNKAASGEKECARLRALLKTYDEKCDTDAEEREAKLCEARRSLEAAKKRQDATDAELKRSVAQVVSLEAQMRDVNDTHARNKAESDEEHGRMVAKLKQLKDKLKRSEESYDAIAQAKNEAYTAHKREVEEMQSKIGKLNKEVQSLWDRESELKVSLRKAENAADDRVNDAKTDLGKRNAALAAERDRLTDDLRSVRLQLQKATDDWASERRRLADKVEDLQMSKATITERLDSCAKQLADTKATADAMRDNRDVAVKQLKSVQADRDALASEKAATGFGQHERDAMRTRHDKATADNKAKERRIEELEREKEGLMLKVDATDVQNKADCERLRASNEKLNAAQVDANRKIASLTTTNESLTSKCELMQKRSDEAVREISRKEDAIKKAENRCLQMESRVKDLELNLHLSNNEKARQAERNESSVADMKSKFATKLAEFESKYAMMSTELKRSSTAVADGERKLATVTANNTALQAQLKDAEDKLATAVKGGASQKKAKDHTAKHDLNEAQKAAKEAKRVLSDALQFLADVERDLRKVLKDLGTKKAHTQLKHIVETVTKKVVTLNAKGAPSVEADKGSGSNADDLENARREIASLREQLDKRDAVIRGQQTEIESLSSIKSGGGAKKSCFAKSDATDPTCDIRSDLPSQKKSVTFNLAASDGANETAGYSDDEKIQHQLKSLQTALAEAAQERCELIAAADDEIAYWRAVASDIERTLVDDFEWKLHLVRAQLDEVYQTPEAAVNGLDSRSGRRSEAAVQHEQQMQLAEAIARTAAADKLADELRAASDAKSAEISALNARLTQMASDHQLTLQQLKSDSDCSADERIASLTAEHTATVDDLKERLESALGKKLEHMLALREEIEEEYAERMEELRTRYTAEMERQADQSQTDKLKYVKTEAQLQATLSEKRSELSAAESRAATAETLASQLTVRLENQTLEVMRLQAELDVLEYRPECAADDGSDVAAAGAANAAADGRKSQTCHSTPLSSRQSSIDDGSSSFTANGSDVSDVVATSRRRASHAAATVATHLSPRCSLVLDADFQPPSRS